MSAQKMMASLAGVLDAHRWEELPGLLQHFEVATFIAVCDGLISDMTEVWTDVAQVAPFGTRQA